MRQKVVPVGKIDGRWRIGSAEIEHLAVAADEGSHVNDRVGVRLVYQKLIA